MRFNFWKNKKYGVEVEPDEIFLDAQNMPEFNTQQFEGRIERPISKLSITVFSIVCGVIGIIFFIQLAKLQLVEGRNYFTKSENNSEKVVPIFAPRGIIYDRKGIPLAWNEENKTEDEFFPIRQYSTDPGFAHLLGYVDPPSKDRSGIYWQEDFIGKDGIEEDFDDILRGENGERIFGTDAHGNILAEGLMVPSVPGNNIELTIDANLQTNLHTSLVDFAKHAGFSGGSAIIIDIENGEILALTNYPEYDPNIMAHGQDATSIRSYFKNPNKPFINRAISGLYTPGSIVKPFVAIGALTENIIDPNKKIFSSGQLVLPNPYSPGNDSIFKDWKAHGWVDMRRAIAVSSNVYFYQIGGGFEGQKGLGITNIEKYIRLFDIGEKTEIDISGEVSGTIPNPAWKKKNFSDGTWRLGDTYHTAIGQYGFQVTPIQMVRAVAAIASRGVLVTPHVIKKYSEDVLYGKIEGITDSSYTVVQEGMRQVVTDGTALGLNLPNIEIAAKTGTAQVGISKKRMNSWAIGFFPYEKPKYAFVVLMENAASTNTLGASNVMRVFFEYMRTNTPEYLTTE
jgi:penicillin-binding protein 2